MTTLREAAWQMLEALDAGMAISAKSVLHDRLRAALAQQEQEPVAWRYKGMMGMPWSLSDDGYYVSCKRDKGYLVEPLYAHPPRREWQSLTEEEINEVLDNNLEGGTSLFDICRAIEAALKEKNT